MQANESESSGAGAIRPRILVVDDDQVDRIAFGRTLAAAGVVAEVSDAAGVLEAIDLLAASRFDCVFLDYNLPDGDGLTFLRGVRAAGITTPVVILTGEMDDALAMELFVSGAADFISKGDLTPARLGASLRRVLHGSGSAVPNPLPPGRLHDID